MRKEKRFRIGKIRGEWTWLTGSCGASLEFGCHDTAISLGIRLMLFSLYLSFGSWRFGSAIRDRFKRADETYGNGRSITAYFYEDGLWFAIWHDPMDSRHSDPWYAKMHVIRPLDILLGRRKYSSKTLKVERAIVPMPEGGYPATVELNEDSWKRPRWPFPTVRHRANVTPDKPIPFPGKGENSYDCGEDATHSMYCSASTALEAVMQLSQSVMNSRIRYGGGWNYQPEKQNA